MNICQGFPPEDGRKLEIAICFSAGALKGSGRTIDQPRSNCSKPKGATKDHVKESDIDDDSEGEESVEEVAPPSPQPLPHHPPLNKVSTALLSNLSPKAARRMPRQPATAGAASSIAIMVG